MLQLVEHASNAVHNCKVDALLKLFRPHYPSSPPGWYSFLFRISVRPAPLSPAHFHLFCRLHAYPALAHCRPSLPYHECIISPLLTAIQSADQQADLG